MKINSWRVLEVYSNAFALQQANEFHQATEAGY
jgi:hypothetical protein